MKIVVLDGYTLNPGDLSWAGLKSFGELKVYDRTPKDSGSVLNAIGDADIVFTNKTPLTAETLTGAKSVRYIGVLATGYNVVDIEAARGKGIIVTNVPSYATDSVAQMTFALLLEICHRVGMHDESVKKGEWSASVDFCYWKSPLVELSEKTFGIIGYGNIGMAVARIARAFGMEVIASDTSPSGKSEGDFPVFVETGELFRRSDIISLHCPLTDTTKGIINKESISEMKDGVIIINTSRGPLIVEKDLAEALDNRKVFAAAVDVVSVEPVEPQNPLLKAANCFITPHIAWAPREARARLIHTAIDNLRSFLEGNPVNVITR